MSLSSAISNALSGVTATTRGTEVVSSNIANKSVAGYARREVELSSRMYAGNGGGVSIDGVQRMVNAGLLADSRLAQSAAANSDTTASFHASIEASFGPAGSISSLDGLLTSLGTSLASASARPDLEVRLNAVLDAASGLAGKLNDISRTLVDARTNAEKSIASDVTRLNTGLDRVATLNRQITVMVAQGGDASSLVDARQATIDDIATIVPMQEVARENGRVALFTKGGATLLDGSTSAKIEFEATGHVAADMTVANGSLSNLTFNGKSLNNSEMGIFSGGTLAANFEIRDTIAPAYQTQIDALARELYDRFADPGVDLSLNIGQAGIFTDNQTAFTAGNELGLAGRISVSALIDPDKGGNLWKIRAGMNAIDAGTAGDSRVLLALGTALDASRAPASAALTPNPRTMLGMISELSSNTASLRIRTQAAAVQDTTRANTLRTALLAQGVDTDTEMEALLSLERAYAANAKVLQTANNMLDQILGLR